jgi:hypothetical protein
MFESGMIWAPDEEFAEEVIEECASFPYGDNDDLVDSTTQAIMRFRHEVLFEEKKPRKNFNTGGTPYDARATTQDFTNALDKVGAGTDLQKAVAIGEYGQNARRQNPFKNLGFLDTQRHFDNNQLLKNAVTRGELSRADYNRLGGFDVAQTMGAGNPVLGGIGNLIGSTGYNIVQSLKGNQSPFDIPGDVFRNVQGGTGLISDDLKTQYESIINQKAATPTPDASTDRPTMADVAGPSTSNNLLSLFERYKDIQTPVGPDPNNPDFIGETALGNIEKGVKGFLTSDRGLKYGKDIPSDINDIYSFIEAQRRSFSPDLSQNYQGGDLYNYLQDFYTYKYGDPRIELPSGNYGYYDEQGPDGPVSNERENIFKSYFNQPYKFGLASGGRVGLFMGGDPLTGQALSIYNSMKSYDFTDQQIADALSEQGLYGVDNNTNNQVTTVQDVINQNANPSGSKLEQALLNPLKNKSKFNLNAPIGINRNDKTFIDPLNEKIANQMITQNPNLNKYTTEEIVSMNPDIFDIKTDKGFIGNTIDNFKTMGGNLIDKFSGSKIGEGITSGATKFKNFAITPMMALMQKRNPLNPGATNYNPNLQKQMDFLEGQTGTKITGTSGNLKFD